MSSLIAYCVFPSNTYKEYAYYCPFPQAEPGMDAIVDTPSSGLCRVTIKSLARSGTSSANKPLVALVDDKTERRERARIAKEKLDRERKFEIIKRLNALQKESEDLKRFTALAKTNPEARALLRELKNLK